MEPTFKTQAELWRWKGEAAWHFLTIPLELSKKIKSFETERRGFGSIRVEASIGKTTWKTSIFPEKKGTYVLPVKAAVRKKEGIEEGDTVKLSLTLQV